MKSKKATLFFMLTMFISLVLFSTFECIDSSDNPSPYLPLSSLTTGGDIPTSMTTTSNPSTSGGIITSNTFVPPAALAWDKLATIGANNINAVCVLDGSNGWAVGAVNSSNQYIYKFTGTNWIASTSSSIKNCILYDIDGTITSTGSAVFYAVGGSGATGNSGDLIFRYTGTWGKVNDVYPSTSSYAPSSALLSVCVVSLIQQYIGGKYGRIKTYDNNMAFSPIEISTSDNLTGLDINAIDFFNSSRGFFAGGFSASNTGYIVKYSNGAWIPEGFSDTPEYITNLVMTSTNSAFAVGNSGKKYKYAGSAWQTVPALNGNTSNLRGLFALNSTNIWACGDVLSSNAANLQYCNGSTWYQVPVSNMSGIGLNAIFMLSSSKGFAFGNSGNIAVGN